MQFISWKHMQGGGGRLKMWARGCVGGGGGGGGGGRLVSAVMLHQPVLSMLYLGLFHPPAGTRSRPCRAPECLPPSPGYDAMPTRPGVMMMMPSASVCVSTAYTKRAVHVPACVCACVRRGVKVRPSRGEAGGSSSARQMWFVSNICLPREHGDGRKERGTTR